MFSGSSAKTEIGKLTRHPHNELDPGTRKILELKVSIFHFNVFYFYYTTIKRYNVHICGSL
jgi:hypothetical protein